MVPIKLHALLKDNLRKKNSTTDMNEPLLSWTTLKCGDDDNSWNFWGHPTWSSKSFSSRQELWSRHKGYNDFGMFKKVNFRVALIKNNYNVCLNVKIKWCPIFLIILVYILQKLLKFVGKICFYIDAYILILLLMKDCFDVFHHFNL